MEITDTIDCPTDKKRMAFGGTGNYLGKLDMLNLFYEEQQPVEKDLFLE